MSTVDPAASRMPEEPHDVSRPMPHHKVPYFIIFWVLVALTAVTVYVAIQYRFKNELVNVLLALCIASIKGLCVALFFMHLKYEWFKLYFLIIPVAILGVVMIIVLLPDQVAYWPNEEPPAALAGSHEHK